MLGCQKTKTWVIQHNHSVTCFGNSVHIAADLQAEEQSGLPAPVTTFLQYSRQGTRLAGLGSEGGWGVASSSSAHLTMVTNKTHYDVCSIN